MENYVTTVHSVECVFCEIMTYDRCECGWDERRDVSGGHVDVDEVVSVNAVECRPDGTDDAGTSLVDRRLTDVEECGAAVGVLPTPGSHVGHQVQQGAHLAAMLTTSVIRIQGLDLYCRGRAPD